MPQLSLILYMIPLKSWGCPIEFPIFDEIQLFHAFLPFKSPSTGIPWNQGTQNDGQQQQLTGHGEVIEGCCVGHDGQFAVDGQAWHGSLAGVALAPEKWKGKQEESKKVF